MITLPHRVTLSRAGTTTDRYNNRTRNWATATTTEDVPAWVQQQTTTVDLDENRSAIVTRWVVFMGPTTDVADGDRLTWRGRVFVIDGDPAIPSSPVGDHHIEAVLQTVAG